GAVIILNEMRSPTVPLFAMDSWRPVAHARTDVNGEFRFSLCLTERPFLLHWDAGQPKRPDNEYTELAPRVVRAKLYARPPFAESLDSWVEMEDPSFTKSCRGVGK